MPDLDPIVWLLIAAAIVTVILLVVRLTTRSQRRQIEQEQKIRRSQTWRVASIAVLLAVIIVFAVANAHSVEVDWVFTETNAPLVVVVALTGVVGFLLGALAVFRRRSDR